MTKTINSVGVVCLANYCRSPVAKELLRNKFKNSLRVDSAGINPFVSAGMDARSNDFLTSLDVIFAMDTHVLMHLNKTYKNFRNKFKLFTFQHRNIQIKDPYSLSAKEYKKVMNNIKFVVDLLELN